MLYSGSILVTKKNGSQGIFKNIFQSLESQGTHIPRGKNDEFLDTC